MNFETCWEMSDHIYRFSLHPSRETPPATPLGSTAPSPEAVVPVHRQGFSFLQYSSRLKLLLCQRCQYAVAGDQLRAHIAKAYPEHLRHESSARSFQAYTF